MGDRANIIVKSYADTEVYLYSHWDGEDILKSAMHGLKSGRVTDAQYLPRIIFQHMLGSDTGETGYGISGAIGDNEYPIITIDCDGPEAMVWFADEAGTELTKKIPAFKFIELVESNERWPRRDLDGIYAELIEAIGK